MSLLVTSAAALYSSVKLDFYINRMCLVIMRNYLAAHVYLAASSSICAYLVRLEEALAVADQEGVQGVRSNSPPPPTVYKYQ